MINAVADFRINLYNFENLNAREYDESYIV